MSSTARRLWSKLLGDEVGAVLEVAERFAGGWRPEVRER